MRRGERERSPLGSLPLPSGARSCALSVDSGVRFRYSRARNIRTATVSGVPAGSSGFPPFGLLLFPLSYSVARRATGMEGGSAGKSGGRQPVGR